MRFTCKTNSEKHCETRKKVKERNDTKREKEIQKRRWGRETEKEKEKERERGICYGNIYLLVASILVFVGSWLATNSFLDLQTKTNMYTHKESNLRTYTHTKTLVNVSLRSNI
jgi:hypothetical protein